MVLLLVIMMVVQRDVKMVDWMADQKVDRLVGQLVF
jgi:hypothetical protein